MGEATEDGGAAEQWHGRPPELGLAGAGNGGDDIFRGGNGIVRERLSGGGVEGGEAIGVARLGDEMNTGIHLGMFYRKLGAEGRRTFVETRCGKVGSFSRTKTGGIKEKLPMKEQKFEARLTARGPKGAWAYLPIPFNVEKAFGKKSMVLVVGTMNGFPFRNSLMPEGDGTHLMAVSKELRAGAKAVAGEMVKVTMRLDEEPRMVELPAELELALKSDTKAAEAFGSLSYSHKKEYAVWVGSAKKEETRTSRATKALAMIREKKHIG